MDRPLRTTATGTVHLAGSYGELAAIERDIHCAHAATTLRAGRGYILAENTAIVLDSTSDFPEASKRFANMRIVPLYVNFGAESFKDHVDIGSHDFYERLKESPTLPTTSQPTPQDFLEVFEELGAYHRIYALQLSAKLSGTFQSASAAAADVGDKVRVVDTETASLAVGLLALAIQRRLAGARPTRRSGI